MAVVWAEWTPVWEPADPGTVLEDAELFDTHALLLERRCADLHGHLCRSRTVPDGGTHGRRTLGAVSLSCVRWRGTACVHTHCHCQRGPWRQWCPARIAEPRLRLCAFLSRRPSI
jgi:hypothetical protein